MKRISEIYDVSKDYEMPTGTVLIIVSDIEKEKLKNGAKAWEEIEQAYYEMIAKDYNGGWFSTVGGRLSEDSYLDGRHARGMASDIFHCQASRYLG